MLLQRTLPHQKLSLSSTLFYSPPFLSKDPNFTPPQATLSCRRHSISCGAISQVHSYGTVDFERRPMVKWNMIYRRISLMENPELGAGDVLNSCDREGMKLPKWELCRVVKELRKYRKFKQALEVYEWMASRGEKYRLSASDAAIQLDLIAKVHGVPTAESYFLRLPERSKDRRIYGALLNVYVQAKMREEAESVIDKMRDKGYATEPLPFNVMMTLYMKQAEYEKVNQMISEMISENIRLDVYSYNIWLSSCGSQGSMEQMEQAFENMKRDGTIIPNWTTFSTMASMYIKMGHLEKAEDCLKKLESRITGRARIPYHYLLSLYGGVGNKEELFRVWKTYKAVFPRIPNMGYHAVLSSLVRMDEIEEAEKIYEEWLSVKSSFDPRLANLLIGWYVKVGNFYKAESWFDHMTEVGGKPNTNSWEILAAGHIGEKRIDDALSCYKEAFSTDISKSWKPNHVNVSFFFKLCMEEGDMASKEVFEGLLMKSGCLRDKAYAELIDLSAAGDEMSVKKDKTDDRINNEEYENHDGSEVIFSQMQDNL